jgi:hypothetical protein
MERASYATTISSAVEFFEGYGTLAVILNVRVDDLRRWAEGKSYPPADVLQRILKLRLTKFQRAAAAAVTPQVRKSA